MIVICVFAKVKPDSVEAFKAATIENARNSVQEPGIARFDVIQQVEDPTRFQLFEAYHSAEAVVAHRSTRHYEVWRDTVADMMAEARTRTESSSLFPPDADW